MELDASRGHRAAVVRSGGRVYHYKVPTSTHLSHTVQNIFTVMIYASQHGALLPVDFNSCVSRSNLEHALRNPLQYLFARLHEFGSFRGNNFGSDLMKEQ